MKTGAFAMVDALGFKGIWTKHKFDAVLGKLQRLNETFHEILDNSLGGRASRQSLAQQGNMLDFVDASFLSDTIVFGVVPKTIAALQGLLQVSGEPAATPAADSFNFIALHFTSMWLAGVLREASLTDPVLAYRGAISFGQFAIGPESRFIVGPAVDDAAAHAEVAQGAFVWFAPSALAVFSRNPLSADSMKSLGNSSLEYRVPLKGGGAVTTRVVNPFYDVATSDECDRISEKLLSSFTGSNLDVLVKRQETASFLEFARSKWAPPTPREGQADSAVSNP